MDNAFVSKYIFNIKWVFRYVTIIFLISLIPLIYISRYSHPSADDFSYGNHTVHTWRDTGSIPQTLLAAIEGTKHVYNTWQGSFVAIFLMTLHPAVFNESLYMMGPIVLLLGFVAATMLLLKVVFMDLLKMDKYSCGIFATLFTFISMQFIFCPVEGFYWYNSAMYYTGFHSVSLILFSLTLLSLKSEKIHAKIIYAITVPIFSFLVGGSNFVTALTSSTIMALILAYCIFIKRSKWLVPLLGTLVICAALIVAVVAPGNAVRQEYFQSMNPMSAIQASFVYAFSFIRLVIRLPMVLAFICIIPLAYRITKKSEFTFRYPILVTALMYGVYASTFTPNLYSWSSFGPARVVNINLFALLFFMLFSIIYCCGSVAKYMKLKAPILSKGKYKAIIKNGLIENPILNGILVVLFIIGCVHASLNDVDSMTSISATRSLVTREARTYHDEYLVRLGILQNSDIRHAELPEFTVTPRVLFHTLDITPYATDWQNISLAQFYNKDSVILIPLAP